VAPDQRGPLTFEAACQLVRRLDDFRAEHYAPDSVPDEVVSLAIRDCIESRLHGLFRQRVISSEGDAESAELLRDCLKSGQVSTLREQLLHPSLSVPCHGRRTNR
jgi:hypothetical protein